MGINILKLKLQMKFAILALISTVSAAAGDCVLADGSAGAAACTCTAPDNCKVCEVADAVLETGNGNCVTCADGFTLNTADATKCDAAAKAAAGETCAADADCDTGLKCGTYEAEDPTADVAAGALACVASASCDSDDNITCGDGAIALGASLVAALAVANLM